METKEKKTAKRVRPTVGQVKELYKKLEEVQKQFDSLNGKYQVALANNVRLIEECGKYKREIERLNNRGFFARLFNRK